MPANPNEIFPVVDTDGRVMGKPPEENVIMAVKYCTP